MGQELACGSSVAADLQVDGYRLSGEVCRPADLEGSREDDRIPQPQPGCRDVKELPPLRQIGQQRPQVNLPRRQRLLRSFRCQDPFQANAFTLRHRAHHVYRGPRRHGPRRPQTDRAGKTGTRSAATSAAPPCAPAAPQRHRSRTAHAAPAKLFTQCRRPAPILRSSMHKQSAVCRFWFRARS